jgi:prolyl-tRNA synthetase
MLVRRDTGEKKQVSLDNIADEVRSLLDHIHDNLYENARQGVEDRIFECDDLESVRDKLSRGIAKIFWCGNKDCGLRLEDEIGAGILGIPTEQAHSCSGKCPVCGQDADTQVYVARTY